MSAGGQKRVLVVDDSSLMRKLISEIVASDPDLSVVDVAENGKVALQKVRQHKPDCVLLDLEMPELSGLDTMRRLRLRSPVKIVVLSHLGHEGPRLRAEALRLGAADVIDKPTGAVSRDLRNTRGSLIRQTLRRVLGLPALDEPDRELSAEGAAATASVLSIDVKGLAGLCERVEVTALVELLNEHLALVEKVIRKHEGIVDAHVGGSTLAVFGVPQRRADHAPRAVAAAGELLAACETRRAERREAGQPFVEVGATIVTGFVFAGELGPPRARRFRTMGGASDLAARLGRLTEGYGAELVVCGRTLGAVAASTSISSRRLDVVQLDPEGEPVTLYELLPDPSKVDAGALAAYARGMELYEAG
ncbi:MAG: two-component system, chemotaxis family, protein-glutamate methylesterase/glutaminase, partial [Myxococcales bacterium]|nr:two-component system, chemotaxis family, protein-glutamate methylesterase/glutaminase [Myxococcales bacterium]